MMRTTALLNAMDGLNGRRVRPTNIKSILAFTTQLPKPNSDLGELSRLLAAPGWNGRDLSSFVGRMSVKCRRYTSETYFPALSEFDPSFLGVRRSNISQLVIPSS
jgi:hypothetical protein